MHTQDPHIPTPFVHCVCVCVRAVIVSPCMYVCRAIKRNYITEDMMDMMDPSLMFAIPRLAIVW